MTGLGVARRRPTGLAIAPHHVGTRALGHPAAFSSSGIKIVGLSPARSMGPP